MAGNEAPSGASAALIARYLDVLGNERRLAAGTLENYRRELHALLELAPDRPLARLQAHDIRTALAKLRARGLDPRTLGRVLSAWRGFYRWLGRQDAGLASNPVDGVRAPRAARGLPKALSVEHAVALVSAPAAAGEHQTLKDRCIALRDQAIYELLYSSGLRVSELTQLDVHYVRSPDHESSGWLDLQAAEVTVLGKGGKRRMVPVGAPALAALARWLEVREQCLPATPDADSAGHGHALFLNHRGERIGPGTVRARLKAHALRHGIPAHVHPHMLRHSFAAHLLQSSGDLRAVQELLGHQSIAATQVYARLDFQHLAQAYDSAHPRARRR